MARTNRKEKTEKTEGPQLTLVLNSMGRPAKPQETEDLPLTEAAQRVLIALRDLGGQDVKFVDLKNHSRLHGPKFVQAYRVLVTEKKITVAGKGLGGMRFALAA